MKKFSFFLMLFVSLFLMSGWSGCGKKTVPVVVVEQTVAQGDTVSVNYILTLADGTVKDTSYEEIARKAGLFTGTDPEAQRPGGFEPISFTIGKKQMIPGFEQGVLGMKIKESKKITVDPAQGYGLKNDKLVQMVSGSVFKDAGITPKVGDIFNFQFAPGKIVELSGDMIKIDFNHPLAGETLTFDVTLESITKEAVSTGSTQ